MKKTLMVILLFCSITVSGQTFKQSLSTGCTALNSVAFNDLTATAFITNNLETISICLLNEFGYPVWEEQIKGTKKISVSSKAIVKAGENKIAISYYTNNTFYIREYDLDGNMLNEFPLVKMQSQQQEETFITTALTPLTSGGYAVYYNKPATEGTSDSVFYIRTNDEGEIEESKYIDLFNINEKHFEVLKLSDQEHLVLIDEKLYNFTSGMLAYSYGASGIPYLTPGSVYIFGDRQIIKYALSGGVSVTINISMVLGDVRTDFLVTSEGHIVRGSRSGIKIHASDGSLISQTKFPFYFELLDITQTDEYFILTGQNRFTQYTLHEKKPIIIRLKKDGSLTYLDLSGFNSWESENINQVRLEYSSDDGETWTDAGTFQADDNTVSLHLPIGVYTSRVYGDGILRDILFPPVLLSRNYSRISANSVSMWVTADGLDSHDPISDDSGLSWPGEEGPNAVFADGFLMGYKQNRDIIVNGSTYRTGMAAGPVVDDSANMPPESIYSIFHIKKDFESVANDSLRLIYEDSYNNWPGNYGAPYKDINGNGVFDKDIDEPEFFGDETIFSVTNFADSVKSNFLYGTPPTDVEVRKIVYASDEEPVESAVFKKYQIINKSDEILEDVYFAYWTDDDVGAYVDDYLGVDSSLNMIYSYNSDNMDDNYGEAPPAVAHMMVQGPVLEGEPSDSAFYNYEWVFGKKNMGVTAATVYMNGSLMYADPKLGVSAGSIQMFNNMTGRLWNGDQFVDPNTDEPVNFVLAGDPVSESGWYEGQGWSDGPQAGDRRGLISAGPFDMEPGDTQEVAYAIFLSRGGSNIESVAKLKEDAVKIQQYYHGEYITGVEEKAQPPVNYALYQNYPNPFNATTTIRFDLPNEQAVDLKIYDILGREVYSVTGNIYKAGKNKIRITTNGLASGVYMYRLEAGNFSQVRKMILLK